MLNVSKILNFRQKGPGMGSGMGFIGVYEGLWGFYGGFGGVLMGTPDKWGVGRRRVG